MMMNVGNPAVATAGQLAADVDETRETASAPAIRCSDLRFSYGPRQVLRGVNLSVAPGECLVLLGGNGAGKTTLVRILATLVLVRPTSGQAWIGGFDVTTQAAAVRAAVGVVSHQMYLFPDLTGRENLDLYAHLYGVGREPGRVDELLALVGLSRRASTLVRAMSRGMQRRLTLARALLGDPSVLLLDEPDTGLDGAAIEALVEALGRGRGSGLAALVTTHRVAEGYRLGTRVGVLTSGKLAFESTRDLVSIEELEYQHRASFDGRAPNLVR